MKKITVKPPYIKLGQFLKFVDIISNGGDEKMFLTENTVLVNGVAEIRRGRKLYHGDKVVIDDNKFSIDINESQ